MKKRRPFLNLLRKRFIMGESMDEIERLKEENEQLRKQRDEYKNGYCKFIKVFLRNN